jgi:SAM-dependent methyltransferase
MAEMKRWIKGGLDLLLSPFGLEAVRRSTLHWAPVVWEEWEDLIPPRPLWVTDQEPAFQFSRWTFTWYTYLTLLCGLARDASVLELGCSHGRTMLALVNYLTPPGRYEGLDILPEQVEFARRAIHSRYPHFNFSVAADLHNTNYNPRGRSRPDTYRFPYDDGSFDVIYAASVFTHLIPADAANYLRQSRRVLRPGGRCLFSMCVLDYYRGHGTTSQPFMDLEERLDGYEGVAVRSRRNPEQLIAFSAAVIERMAADAGLRVARIVPGLWSMSHRVAVSEQDLVLFEAI